MEVMGIFGLKHSPTYTQASCVMQDLPIIMEFSGICKVQLTLHFKTSKSDKVFSFVCV
jgi:hypothetical protein